MSARIKLDNFPKWEGTEFLSIVLGTDKYPLFKFCYDYIKWKRMDLARIEETKESYNKWKMYDEKADPSDKDLQVLYSYSERTEDEVRKAINSIEEKLKNAENIGFRNYRKLAAHIIMVSHVIDFDYEQCKNRIINNIRGRGNEIGSELLLLPMPEFKELEKEEFKELEKEFKDFVEKLSEAMNVKNIPEEFSYDPNHIKDLYERVEKDIAQIKKERVFISRYNVEKLVEMLFQASSKQLQDFRNLLSDIYKQAGKSNFVEEDRETMEKILELVSEKLKNQDSNIDKIQRMQFNWLCGNLKIFIAQMSY